MNEIRVVATMVAKEEYKDDVYDALKAVIIPSRRETGNIKYELHQDMQHDGTYVFFEIWKSQDALDKHNETPHFKELINKIDGKLDVLDIKLLKQI